MGELKKQRCMAYSDMQIIMFSLRAPKRGAGLWSTDIH